MGRMMKAATKKDFSEISNLFSEDICDLLLPPHLQLIPGLNEVYELELAFYESKILDDEDIVGRGAYFSQVGGRPTYHPVISIPMVQSIRG